MANQTEANADVNIAFGQKYGDIKLEEILKPPKKLDDPENQYNTEDKGAIYFLSLVLIMMGVFILFREKIMAIVYSSFL